MLQEIKDLLGSYGIHGIQQDLMAKDLNLLLVNAKIAERAINLLFDTLGDCPSGNKDYDKIDCEKLCRTKGREIESSCGLCWQEYFADDNNFTV